MGDSNVQEASGAVSRLSNSSEGRIADTQKFLRRAVRSALRRAGNILDQGRPSQPEQVKPRFCQYMGNNTLLTETYFGRKIYLDSEDLSLTPHIAYEGRWEPWVTEFFLREVRPGDVFIDIGANCGFFSILAAHLVGPTGFVVAFEPQKKLATLVSNSLMINGFDSYSRVQTVAVGEDVGEATLGHVGTLRGSASLTPGFGDGTTLSDQVKVRPLDLALADVAQSAGRPVVPTVMKIDVEGYEFSVWKGMKNVLAECRDLTILLEFAPIRYGSLGQDGSDFVKAMVEEGFTLSVLQFDSTERALSSNTVEDIMQSDHCVDLILRRRAS
jgi:FkbM family methyltransferase